jgi:hypothetical protein
LFYNKALLRITKQTKLAVPRSPKIKYLSISMIPSLIKTYNSTYSASPKPQNPKTPKPQNPKTPED